MTTNNSYDALVKKYIGPNKTNPLPNKPSLKSKPVNEGVDLKSKVQYFEEQKKD